METRNSLGKGLAALLGESSDNSLDKAVGDKTVLDIHKVIPTTSQPRKDFSDDKLEELVSSIKQKGILQPLLVREKESFFEIIAGERRWRAAKKAGLNKVPVVILNCNDEEALEIGLIENLQRQDLNPIEEAESLKVLQDRYQKNQEEIAFSIGKSRSYVANMLRINNLSSDIKDKIRNGAITTGHAKTLINVDDPGYLVEKIIQENLSVRAAEQLSKQLKKGKQLESKNFSNTDNETELSMDAALIAEKLSAKLTLPVTLKITKTGGVVSIYFKSYEELDSIIQKLEGF
jgi:ParB family chromosome partitioning protein